MYTLKRRSASHRLRQVFLCKSRRSDQIKVKCESHSNHPGQSQSGMRQCKGSVRAELKVSYKGYCSIDGSCTNKPGLKSRSCSMTVSAAVRLMPSPPAFVDSRNTGSGCKPPTGAGVENSSIMSLAKTHREMMC